MNDISKSVLFTGPLWGNEDGYYFCPECDYVLKDDRITGDEDIRHKNYCENCGCKLDWSKRNTAGTYINKVQFLADNLTLSLNEIKKCEMKDVDIAIEGYLFAENKNDMVKIVNTLQNAIKEEE